MFSIIVNVARNNVIGCDNTLVFDIKKDLRRFREITTNHVIVMGRKTFESFPKPLPNRIHVVLTKDKSYKDNVPEGVIVLNNIEEVLEKYSNSTEEIFIIGGGEIYKQFLPHTDKLYLTHVDKDAKGDTYFPEILPSEFSVIEKSENYFSDVEQCNYLYANYKRITK